MSYEHTLLGKFDDAFRPQACKLNKQDLDDVKQSAILRVLSEIRRLKDQQNYEVPESKLFNFTYTIIQRTIIDHYRRKNRKIEQATLLMDYSDGHSYLDDDPRHIAFSFICQTTMGYEENGYKIALLRADFARQTHKFSRQERKVIELMLASEEGQGMIMADLAKELGINKSHATRALKKLRQVCGL